MDGRRHGWLTAGLAAGSIAILVNSLLLEIADWLHINIGHGGLLQLLHHSIGPKLAVLGVSKDWAAAGLPSVATPTFKIGFHIAVGLLMALFYAGVLEPLLPRRLTALGQGLLYALLVWLANAAIILPGLGQGFAGWRVLTTGGMLYFGFAHTVFFVLLALLYARFRRRARAPTVNLQ